VRLKIKLDHSNDEHLKVVVVVVVVVVIVVAII